MDHQKHESKVIFVVGMGMGTFFIYFSCALHISTLNTLQHLLTLLHQNQMPKVICKTTNWREAANEQM